MPHLSHDAMQFAYSPAGKPLLPLTLTLGGESLMVEGLLDSGADVNVLPWSAGQTLCATRARHRAKNIRFTQKLRKTAERTQRLTESTNRQVRQTSSILLLE